MAVKEGKKGMNISQSSQLNLFGKSSGGESQTMPWKKRESGGTWGGKDLKPGDQITGTIKAIKDNANARPDKPLHDYILETGKGEVRVWGAAFLEGKFSEDDIGKEIRITYQGLGKAKKGQKPPKQFEVEVKE